jgi:hypothetical protein
MLLQTERDKKVELQYGQPVKNIDRCKIRTSSGLDPLDVRARALERLPQIQKQPGPTSWPRRFMP